MHLAAARLSTRRPPHIIHRNGATTLPGKAVGGSAQKTHSGCERMLSRRQTLPVRLILADQPSALEGKVNNLAYGLQGWEGHATTHTQHTHRPLRVGKDTRKNSERVTSPKGTHLTEPCPWNQTFRAGIGAQKFLSQHVQLVHVETSLGDRRKLPAQHL